MGYNRDMTEVNLSKLYDEIFGTEEDAYHDRYPRTRRAREFKRFYYNGHVTLDVDK